MIKRYMSNKTPTNPSSSPSTATMKSVRASGKNSSSSGCRNRPFPNRPPEPMAVVDWIMFQPPPRDHSVGQTTSVFADADSSQAQTAKSAELQRQPQGQTKAPSAMKARLTKERKNRHQRPMLVPGSGCLPINKAGSTMHRQANVYFGGRGRLRFCRYHATAIGTANFINSDG